MKHRHNPQKVDGDVEGKPPAFVLLVNRPSSLLRLHFNARSSQSMEIGSVVSGARLTALYPGSLPL